jgi:hypothetical protein
MFFSAFRLIACFIVHFSLPFSFSPHPITLPVLAAFHSLQGESVTKQGSVSVSQERIRQLLLPFTCR